MNQQLLQFFNKLDSALIDLAGKDERLDLYLLGRAALILYFDFPLGTQDVDVVKFRTALEKEASKRFGPDTPNAKALGFYLDLVPQGLPPLPHGYNQRSNEIEGNWKVIRLWRLEVHDLAATKLKSFRAKDKEDLQFLCDEGLLEAEKLRFSLEAAFSFSLDKDGDELRDRAFNNLQQVVDYLEGKLPSL